MAGGYALGEAVTFLEGSWCAGRAGRSPTSARLRGIDRGAHVLPGLISRDILQEGELGPFPPRAQSPHCRTAQPQGWLPEKNKDLSGPAGSEGMRTGDLLQKKFSLLGPARLCRPFLGFSRGFLGTTCFSSKWAFSEGKASAWGPPGEPCAGDPPGSPP